ncbi:MAG: PhaM family polyhydroxyalkanoate granule multifunctional regulatory protein [Usitatibacter sp.]
MPKPVTPQEMFDFWQKMVNPGAYPLQSLMFPVLDPKEIDKKISELEVVEHWLKANLNMLQLSIKSLEFQKGMLKGGEKARSALDAGDAGEAPNPAMWAWNMMAQAGMDAMENAGKAAKEPRSAAKKKKAGS